MRFVSNEAKVLAAKIRWVGLDDEPSWALICASGSFSFIDWLYIRWRCGAKLKAFTKRRVMRAVTRADE